MNENNQTVVSENVVQELVLPPQKQHNGLSARTKKKIKQNVVGYLYVMPVILGVLIFTAFPVLYAFVASFFEGTVEFDDLGKFRDVQSYTDIFMKVT